MVTSIRRPHFHLPRRSRSKQKLDTSHSSSATPREEPKNGLPEEKIDSKGDLTATTTASTSTDLSSPSSSHGDSSRHRRRKPRVFSGFSHAVGKLGDTLVPPMTNTHKEPYYPPVKVRLHGCETDEAHREYIATFLECIKDMHGREGLRAVGFDYRFVYCDQHCPKQDKKGSQGKSRSEPEPEPWDENSQPSSPSSCVQCATRLFHVETNELITEKNRQTFIANGEMYEEMARLCQEYAQELMQDEGNLEWVTVCDDETEAVPIRALVHIEHRLLLSGEEEPDERPILLVVTGKGKVMAGIFSRQHLMTTGIEASSAVPMVREAARRNMSAIVLDPNARGDQQGMLTFEKSVKLLLGHLEEETHDAGKKQSLYVVAHSASGSQLVRYLLDRIHIYEPYLRAIAFTDSTHNIQWAKNNASLRQLLGSSQCIYFRSAKESRDSERRAGEAVETDSHWHYRFGKIKTMWAGTKEHSLTNWFAHAHIWEHFDRQLILDPLRLFSGRRIEDDDSERHPGSETT